jgi:hypothetical protein
VADYDFWICHSTFGFPGALNDINIWDRSTLFQSMLDGSHATIDFPFKINGDEFKELFYLVDGIYPWLSQFLSTVSDPTTNIDRLLAKSQESWRKAIERAFGVLKRKFLVIKHPIEMHDRHDIFYVVIATILLHSMMVEVRMGDD